MIAATIYNVRVLGRHQVEQHTSHVAAKMLCCWNDNSIRHIILVIPVLTGPICASLEDLLDTYRPKEIQTTTESLLQAEYAVGVPTRLKHPWSLTFEAVQCWVYKLPAVCAEGHGGVEGKSQQLESCRMDADVLFPSYSCMLSATSTAGRR